MSDTAPSRKRASLTQIAVATLTGTTIEWYDFFIYGTAAALVFPTLFFPKFDPLAGLLASFFTFWIGFIGRPTGGILFGHFGDRIGRKTILVLTLIIMGICTFLIGVLPTYDTIGIFAPILLVLLRFIQGVAIGGEWGGAVLLATEHSTTGRRGFYGSWPQMGAPLGTILSALAFVWVAAAFPGQQLLAFGWRIPFLISIILVAVGLFVRLRIAETPDFERVKETREIVRVPIFQVLRRDWKNVLLAAGIFIAVSGPIYLYTTWILSYAAGPASVLKLSRGVILNAVVLSSLVMLGMTFVAGFLSDRFGRRNVSLAGAICLILAAFPVFMLVDTRNFLLITLGLGIGQIGTGLLYGPLAAYFTELFGANVRYSGASLGYQSVSVIAGGLSPFIATGLLALSGNASWSVALYIVVVAVISLISISLSRPAVTAAVPNQAAASGSAGS
jgi:MHS family shikimate/dehydroshikimate transporter-like MFS transporter